MALNPELADMVKAASAKHREHRNTNRKHERKQVAALIAAVEIAAKAAPERASEFRFAVGFLAGQILETEKDWIIAKELAAA